jgi:hypothetical protein
MKLIEFPDVAAEILLVIDRQRNVELVIERWEEMMTFLKTL